LGALLLRLSLIIFPLNVLRAFSQTDRQSFIIDLKDGTEDVNSGESQSINKDVLLAKIILIHN
jgi:hypothetical protein